MKKVESITIAIVALALSGAVVLAGCSRSEGAPSQGGQAGAGAQAPAGAPAPAQAGERGASGGRQGNGQGAGGGQFGGRRNAVVPVQALTVHIGLLNADRTTAGVIIPAVQSQVATQVAGFVARVPRSVGEWVRQGDIVIQLDDSQLKLTAATAASALENAKINLSVGQDNSSQANPKLGLQVQSAQSAYDSAKKYYDAQKALFDLGGISASQLDTANSQLTAAQANLEGAKTALDQNNNAGDQTIAQLKIAVQQAQNNYDQAQLNLRNASIRAPFAGQISAINVQPGMSASVSAPVFTLVSAAKQISFNVPPSDAPFLKSGMPIVFNFQGKDYPVRISQAPAAPISGVLPMVASAAGIELQYGSVGEINYSIPLAKGAIIPIASLDTLENQNFVYVVRNGRVATLDVTIAAESGTSAAVLGLQDGEVVVVSPPPGLLSGSQVQTMMIDQQGGASGQAANGQALGSQKGNPTSVGKQGGASYSGQYSGQGKTGSGGYSGQRKGGTSSGLAGSGAQYSSSSGTATAPATGSGQ
ncbi:MAG TPA: HlyD family efflux transporter periplasmic adaptor subunit [Rectinemataceae bacterium]|nr:HlyD family efflux transporter periplasmic adaptor subunit [Rectinemataceae bacterium]